MPFFMNKHYSTAQKIINTVEKKISVALKEHPKIVSAEAHVSVHRYLVEKRNLAVVLGDILKDNLSKSLYAKYQRLKENEKNELRNKVADEYFLLLQKCIKNFNDIQLNVHICTDYGDHKWDDPVDYGEVYITLPDKFFQKNTLAPDLQNAVLLFQHELIVAEKDTLQLRVNTL